MEDIMDIGLKIFIRSIVILELNKVHKNINKMIVIEKYPCYYNREAEKRENEIMKELKSNMNTNKSHLSEEEFKELKRTYHKSNAKLNTMKVNQIQNEYYKYNKEKINERKNPKESCECGCKVTKSHLRRHERTNKHINIMKKINE